METTSRPTKYITVSSFIKDQTKEHIRRKIKLILVDHYSDKGVPYQRYADDTEEEDDVADQDGQDPVLLDG